MTSLKNVIFNGSTQALEMHAQMEWQKYTFERLRMS